MFDGSSELDTPANLLAAATAAHARGEHRHGARLAHQAASSALAQGLSAVAGEAQVLLALQQVRLGDLASAAGSCQQALVLLAVDGPPALLAQAHNTLSMAYERAGLHALALTHAVTALETARGCGDVQAECAALNRLGVAMCGSGDGQGLDLLKQALALASGLPSIDERFSVMNNLSRRWVLEADRLSGEPAQQALLQALPLAETAAGLARTTSPGFPLATALANLGGIHRRLGNAPQARLHFGLALELARAQAYSGLVATVELALACLAFEAAPDSAGQQALAQQLEGAECPADPDLRLQARHLLVRGSRARGDLATALDQLEKLRNEERAAQTDRAQLQSRLLRGRVELEQARHAAQRLAQDRDLLEQEVASRTAELQRAKSAAEAASRAKSAFLTVVSHELRTPLNGMLGMMELVRLNTHDARQAEQLDVAIAAGWQLNGLFDNLLNYVAADAQAPLVLEPTRLRELLQGALAHQQAAAQAKGMAIELLLPDSLPAQLLLDGQRLRQIIDVLINNAVKFSRPGTLRLRASWQQADRGTAQLRVELADNGPGLSDAALGRLFRPFELGDASSTRRHGGLGLGLALAKRLAQGMGGDLGVDNQPPTGCTFWVRVPCPCAAGD